MKPEVFAPPTLSDLPRLLADFEPASGIVKADYSDFVVEELPLYDFSGSGDHSYFLLEKAGLTTQQALDDLAGALGVARRQFGYAGLKDSRAITRQWISVEHVDEDRLRAVHLPRIKIVDVTQHTNKLKLGHLRGNRFTIRVRETSAERVSDFDAAMKLLAKRGVPNYFGQQRFGGRGDTGKIGLALLQGRLEDALDLVLGRPSDLDHGKVRQARAAFDRADYAAALRLWPPMFRDQRRALRTLTQGKANKRRAFGAIDRATRQFYVSAFQSELFNQVVAARVPLGLDQVLMGDLAQLHRNGAVFLVKDPAAERPRVEQFEISPTGPLFGKRMTPPTEQPLVIEDEVLQRCGLEAAAFETGGLRATGGRRALRFQPTECGVEMGADGRGVYLELRFVLPKGSYATVLLRELFSESLVAAVASPN